MPNAAGNHANDLSFQQFDTLVLVQDAGLDHALVLVGGEAAAFELWRLWFGLAGVLRYHLTRPSVSVYAIVTIPVSRSPSGRSDTCAIATRGLPADVSKS